MKIIITMVTIIAFLSACSSSTVIKSIPTGAKVYLNDEYVGETPHKLTDSRIIFATNNLRLKKEGYDDLVTIFRKDEEANVGALIGGFCLLVPFLWGMSYKAERTYELTEQNGASKP